MLKTVMLVGDCRHHHHHHHRSVYKKNFFPTTFFFVGDGGISPLRPLPPLTRWKLPKRCCVGKFWQIRRAMDGTPKTQLITLVSLNLL